MNPYFELYTNAQRMSIPGFINLLKFALLHSEEDINQLFYSNSQSVCTYTTLTKHFLDVYQHCSIEDIKDILPALDLTIMVGRNKIEGSHFVVESFTKKGFDDFLSNNENLKFIAWEEKEVAYELFTHTNQIYYDDKFKLVYEHIEKSMSIQRDYLLKESNIFENLLKNQKFDLFNYLADKHKVTINDMVDGKPLYFNLDTKEGIDFLLEKNGNLDLVNIHGESYLKILSNRQNGKDTIKYLNSKTEIDLEQSLLDFLSQGKTLTEIKDLWAKLAKKQNVKKNYVSIKGYNIWQQALRSNHIKFMQSAFLSLTAEEQSEFANVYTQNDKSLVGLLLESQLPLYGHGDSGGRHRTILYQALMGVTDFGVLFSDIERRTAFLEDILLGGLYFLRQSDDTFKNKHFDFLENAQIVSEIQKLINSLNYDSGNYYSDSYYKDTRNKLYAKFIDHISSINEERLVNSIANTLIDCEGKPFSMENPNIKPLIHYVQNYLSEAATNDLVNRIIIGLDNNLKSQYPLTARIIPCFLHLIKDSNVDLNKKQLSVLMKVIETQNFINLNPDKLQELEANFLKKHIDGQLFIAKDTTPKRTHKL